MRRYRLMQGLLLLPGNPSDEVEVILASNYDALMKDAKADHEAGEAFLRNEQGNVRALLRHVVKLEKKAGTFKRKHWEDWLRDYKVKA